MATGRYGQSATARSPVGRARGPADQADWRSALARAGLAAKGALYATLGLLAIQVAAGDASSQSANPRGAIELVASQPFGQWLLGFLTLGLFALAIWQVLLAFTGDPVEGSKPRDRAKYAVKAIAYFATASTALGILTTRWGAPGGGGEASQDRAAATVMSWPGGPWIVAAGGLALIALAIYQLYAHAWRRRFMRRLDVSGMSREMVTGVARAGRAGYAARGIVFGIVGAFFVVAAVQHDPQEAVGLSGALHALSAEPGGQAVLWLVAVGVFAYGCFCFAEAKYRRAV